MDTFLVFGGRRRPRAALGYLAVLVISVCISYRAGLQHGALVTSSPPKAEPLTAEEPIVLLGKDRVVGNDDRVVGNSTSADNWPTHRRSDPQGNE
eukprot:5222974-Pyramimonas_sp.AAC.1